MSTATKEAAAEDHRLLRHTAARFASRHLKAAHDSPEQVPSPEDFGSAVSSARAAGILAGEAGAGMLWAEGEPLQDSLAILDILGSWHAGVAFHLHRLALGEWLAARIGLAGGDDALVPWLPDGHTLPEPALVAFLARGETAPALAALLPQAGQPMHWCCAEPWDALLVPVVHEGAVRLCLAPRLAIVAESPATHGLDGIVMNRAPFPEIALAQAPPAIGRELLAALLGLDALGLVAISLGVVRDAQRRARSQAASRRQGGKRIEEHAAVQAMLAEIEGAIAVAGSLLEVQRDVPRDIESLARVHAHRLVAHDGLCRAANAAMQVYGGSGYMRDMGLERAVRDCNQLRIEGGAPGDLKLFIARAALETPA